MLWTTREHAQVNAAFEETFSCLQVSAAWMTSQRQSQVVATNVSMYRLLWDVYGLALGGRFQELHLSHADPEVHFVFCGQPVSAPANWKSSFEFWGNDCNAWLDFNRIFSGRVSAIWLPWLWLHVWMSRRLSSHFYGGSPQRLSNSKTLMSQLAARLSNSVFG